MQSADATPLFPDTRWSLVLRTRDFTHASKALEELCRTYWYPLYVMARRSGSSHADAEDLTQGFFCCIMQRDLFPRADQRMGKLRSYLLTSFKHFSISEWRKVARRPDQNSVINMDWKIVQDRFADTQPGEQMSPDKIFLRQWTVSLLEAAMADLTLEMERIGKMQLFAILRPLLELDGEHGQQEKDAQAAGMSYSAFRVALTRLRRRFGVIIREKVADTLDNPTGEEIDAELRELRHALE